jgi:acyl-CoA thioester hydrolase
VGNADSHTRPFISPVAGIEPAWIDYNGHLNMAYYLVLFDRGYEAAAKMLGMGADYARTRRMTTYTGDARIAYLNEVHQDADLVTSYQILDHDEKRIHAFQQLRHAGNGKVAATCESLTLHIDMEGPKVCAFPPDIMERVEALAACHAGLPRPAGVGKPIGLRRRPGRAP